MTCLVEDRDVGGDVFSRAKLPELTGFCGKAQAGGGAWPAGERFPASVRWLPTESARRVGVRPRVPDGAAGCVVYRFGSPGEAGDTVEIVRVVNGRGHGQVAGLWIRASARFCAAYQDQVKTRLPAARDRSIARRTRRPP